MVAQFPENIYVARETENLPGIVYNPTDKKNFYSEDFQGLGEEITAIETSLKRYKSFVGYIKQDGENNPNVVVLQNDFPHVPIFSRVGVGEFIIESDGYFTDNKTAFFIGNLLFNKKNGVCFNINSISSSNMLRFNLYDSNLYPIDGIDGKLGYFNTYIEIRVYETEE